MYTKVVTVVDMCNSECSKILQECYDGIQQESSLSWSRQENPDDRDWAEWRKLLRRFFIDE